jgi:hypothetical protein
MQYRVWLRDAKKVEKLEMPMMPIEAELQQWRQEHKRWVIEEKIGKRWLQVGGSSVS